MSKIAKTQIIEKDTVSRYNYPDEVECAIICGDIHGSFTEIAYKVSMQFDIHNALVIVAGDCGFGFNRLGFYDSLYQRKIAKLLKRNNIRFAFVRGNHDNPAYFDGNLIEHERWRTVDDYSVICAAGHIILCVGGAISIDRNMRVRMKNNTAEHYDGIPMLRPAYYWSDEPPVFDVNRLNNALELAEGKIDTVVTHTAPSFCEFSDKGPMLLDFAKADPDLLDDCEKERAELDKLYNALKEHNVQVENWIYGHFHASRRMNIDNIMFTMLDCEELKDLH